MVHRILTSSWLMLIAKLISAQVAFKNSTDIYCPDFKTYSGVAGAFVDINNDFHDDLVILDKGLRLKIGINNGDGAPMTWVNGPKVSDYSEFTLNVADLDKDGLSEIMVGGFHGNMKIYKQNGDYIFYQIDQPEPPIFFQATNLLDINLDGWLDLYACNDHGPSITLINNQSGKLISQELIDWTTVPPSDMSGSYGSEWTDVDGDGDADLYIAKCKFGVTNREDPRRHNMLYIQQSDGSFVNEAEERGMKNKDQSWTCTSSDYDNDGDFDFFITNHDAPHLLMENDGTGHFESVNYYGSGLMDFAYQALWRDFDNNGFEDILVTGEKVSYILFNQDGNSFVKSDDLLGINNVNSAAIGDINNDGFLDIIAYFSNEINKPGVLADAIFENEGNANHYVRLGMEEQSGITAIGTKVSAYGAWGVQTREIRSGEGYGVTNTGILHFGLGNATIIDSIIVRWPNGEQKSYYDIAADQLYTIDKSSCLKVMVDAWENALYSLCNIDQIGLSAPDGFSTYEWNTGEKSKSVVATIGNAYSAVLIDAQGCRHFTERLYVRSTNFDSETAIANYPNEDTLSGCAGDKYSLIADEKLHDLSWSNDTHLANIEVEAPATISLLAKDICGNEVKDTMVVLGLDPGPFNITNDTVAIGETAMLHAGGEIVNWYLGPQVLEPFFSGNNLQIPNVTGPATYYVEAIASDPGNIFRLGKFDFPTNGNEYSADNFNGGLIFTVYKDVHLKSFKVKTDLAGVRKFRIVTKSGVVFFEKLVDLPVGEYVIQADVDLPPGAEYRFTTDDQVNVQNFGYVSPRLVRSADEVVYPYGPENVFEILTSLGGLTTYYYFYDITISSGAFSCSSNERSPVEVVISTSVVNSQSFKVYLFPNPVNEVLEIQQTGSEAINLKIVDGLGKCLLQKDIYTSTDRIVLSSLTSGIYFAIFTDNNGRSNVQKITKIE